jgi:hypothetical protein
MPKKTHSCIERWNEGLLEPLKKTLQYAKEHIPYYASQIKTIEGQTISALLKSVPVLDKETAIDNLQELRKDTILQPGRISTGTLRRKNRFMDVQYIQAEDNAIQCFYRNNRSWSHAYDFDQFKDSSEVDTSSTQVLRILNPHYEVPHHFPSLNTVCILWTSHANSIAIIRKTLMELKEIHILDIEASTFIKLTLMLEQSHFDFKAIQIGSVTLHGFISNRWRSLLQAKWNTSILDVFSLSEMRAKAYSCQHSAQAHFHFEPLPVVTEVLHPMTKEPIDSGAGLLALTPLYPFAQQQMLLRYLTQDVVKIVPCTRTSKLGFSWRGRTRDVVFLDKKDKAHSAFGLREVIECLDHYYEIARSEEDFETLGIIEPGSVGWPLCHIEETKQDQVTTLKVHLVLVYPPTLFPERTKALCEKIKKELIDANDYLQKKSIEPELKIEIVPYPPSKRNHLDGWSQGDFQKIIRSH